MTILVIGAVAAGTSAAAKARRFITFQEDISFIRQQKNKVKLLF